MRDREREREREKRRGREETDEGGQEDEAGGEQLRQRKCGLSRPQGTEIFTMKMMKIAYLFED